ncbi:MAG: transcriptional repressor LexA [Hyphomicrobium sp.]
MLTELEKKILAFIGEYLRGNDGRGPTLAEIGEGCGVNSVGTIHRYLASIESKGFLKRSRDGWRTRLAPNELPFRGKIAAGRPIEAIEHADSIDLVSLLVQPDCFVLKVEGDSMEERGIFDGDLVVVKSASTASDGQIVVALVDNEATLKEFRKLDGGRKIKLVPHNRKFEPKTYRADEVEVQGILCSVIRTDP